MAERKHSQTQDQQLEALLMASLPDPPPQVTARVTPWRTATRRALAGMALCAVTLNFWGLNYLLPGLGLALSLLGFRALRGENGWFASCWGFVCCRGLCFCASLVLQATLVPEGAWGRLVMGGLTLLSCLSLVLLAFCLWRGLLEVQRKAGQPPGAPAAAALILWYALVCLLTALPVGSGLWLGLGLLLAYGLLFASLCRLPARLEEAGYAISPRVPRLSDRSLVGGILLALGAALACAYLFGGHYPMDWQPAAREAPSPTAAETRAHLTALGFPADLLANLTDADLADCAGAAQVSVSANDHPMNRGRTVTTQTPQGTVTDQVFDQTELRLTGVAVRLAEEDCWRLFQFFQWREQPGYWGTESIRLQPAYQTLSMDWNDHSPVTGRVLYDRAGVTYTAPYAFLDHRTYYQPSLFFGPEESAQGIFAAFSLPKAGENQRGYLTYAIQAVRPGVPCAVNSLFDYTHQRSPWQYPVQSAMAYQATGGWLTAAPFVTAQEALQFYSHEGIPWT